MIEILYAILILILAIPIGVILKKITKEEIDYGKNYFQILSIMSITIAIFLLFLPIESNLKKTAIFSLIFIAIVSFISYKE